MTSQEQPSIDGRELGARRSQLHRAFLDQLKMTPNRSSYYANMAHDLVKEDKLSIDMFLQGTPAAIRAIVDQYLEDGEDTGDGSTNTAEIIRDARREEMAKRVME
jgi:hypothetical protein